MPIYEYYCEPCKVQVECLKSIVQMDKVITCPSCRRPMKRVMSRLGLVKGGYTPKFYGKD